MAELHHHFQAFKSVRYVMDYTLVLGEERKIKAQLSMSTL